MAKFTWLESDNLQHEVSSADVSAVRATGRDPIPGILRDPEVADVLEIASVQTMRPRPRVRSTAAAPPEVAVKVEVDDGSDYLMLVRHPSGALTFHDGTVVSGNVKRSGARPETYTIEFRAKVARTIDDDVRRGVFDSLVDAVVDAIVVKIKEVIAETAVDLAEMAIWKLLRRKEGLFSLAPGVDGLSLTPVRGKMKPGPGKRALLFIHGTFSTTQGSFGDLTDPDFFRRLTKVYGDAIYGFEHFSVSVTPEKNALDILKKLPAAGIEVDVVTHSRGGLVLRTLAERASELAGGERFRLGRAVLIACPNEGTPLATPERWKNTVGWLANVLDMFPPNPVTSNIAMVAHWITWFAKTAVKAAEGLDAMNAKGTQINTLNKAPSPVPGKYSALVSNFTPDRRLWARALDLGVDFFFASANDLVVPTENGWRIDRALLSIPDEQVGAYGRGGNLDPGATQVHHVNFFARPETKKFILRGLSGQPQRLPRFDRNAALPTRRGGSAPAAEPVALLSAAQAATPQQDIGVSPDQEPPVQSGRAVAAQPHSSIFELIVLDPGQISDLVDGAVAPVAGVNTPFLYASYDGARVMVPFQFKNAHIPPKTGDDLVDKHLESRVREMRERWSDLFGYDRRVKSVLDGEKSARPLSDAELELFGELLFETLLPDKVRRLYDVARTRETEKLFLIFTSMIPWVFDMPWEFARDEERGTYLATEDVHFIRNVLTPTPVEKLPPVRQLRMLVVTAEPEDQRRVSAAEEAARLHYALRDLADEGLVEFETLERATASKFHQAIALGNYDIVHFIGHGYWSKSSGEAGLVLEDPSGQSSFLGGRALCEVMTGRGIRLVFLNACDTGRSRRSPDHDRQSLTGVAQDIFGRGVPNVIANQFPVGDRAAVSFARAIYHYLANGKSVAQAVREARIATNYERGGKNMDWAVPVVYARNPESKIVKGV